MNLYIDIYLESMKQAELPNVGFVDGIYLQFYLKLTQPSMGGKRYQGF